jgi:Na+/H+ antiporter NhaD/arsenite permease-like protein
VPTALPLYTVLPFVAMLLAIALFPLGLPHWWESNRSKLAVAAMLGAPVLVLYLARQPGALVHMATDYVSFIILLTGLYVIAGGVRLTGDLEATPLVNAAFLATGTLLASLVGTTGASMLLIRPLLQTNRERARVTHTVVFFIFLVSNIGGMLTPLGDPPLFLGYLQGVPFAWTLRLWGPWLTMTAALLLLYYLWDSREHAHETKAALRRDRTRIEPLRIRGALNGVWLAGVVAAVAFLNAPVREIAILVLAGISLWRTPTAIRRANHFTAGPMVEVAVLFLGIFLTMIPALELLHLRGGELGVRQPWQFFWATGVLSSFLDNAPTYLTFLALAQSLGLPAEVVGMPHVILAAISVGAVAMGANTYIGNAPNFMVKAIAESAGVRMPSFFGYMAYSGAVLLPLFAIVTILFF